MDKVIVRVEKGLLIFIAFATLYAALEEAFFIFQNKHVELADLLLLFIYTEVLGMIAAFYRSSKIPITLPLFIAMTALSRMIILQGKGVDTINLLYEAGAILLISLACLVIRYRPSSQEDVE
ncbi:MAG: phosphate-starvation-inducible PsiE family protein [Parvibaculales bacterium]